MIELLQVSILNIIAKFLKFSFEIGTNYFVDKETYGYFAVLLSYILIYSRIVTFGIPNVLLREFAKSKNKTYCSYLLTNSVVTMLLITFASYVLVYFFQIKYISNYISIPFIALLISLVILFSAYIRSIGEIKLWIALQDISWYLYYFIILFFIYLFSNNNIDISLILNIYTISVLFSLTTILIVLKFKYKLSLWSKISLHKIKYLYSHSFPVLFTGLTYLILARIDVIMLGNYVDIDLVGEYNIVARVALQVLFFHQLIVAYFYPRLAKKFAKKESDEEISYFISRFVFYSFVSVLLLSTILFIWFKYFNLFDLLNIVHKEKLFNVFIIFSITQIVYSTMSFYGYVLLYIHKQKIEYINNIVILIVGIVLNILLIPRYGVEGAAIASTIAIILGSVLEGIEVKYFTNTFFIKFKKRIFYV